MRTERIRVGVVFGGRSGEHAVSLRSAASVVAALDPARFEVVPLAITPEGRWLPPRDAMRLLADGARAAPPAPGSSADPSAVGPEPVRALAPLGPGAALPPLDVVFPVLHGPGGEDGTIQGLLELCDIPYVGAGVLGSALGMDKVAQKDVFLRYGLPVVDHELVSRHEWRQQPETVLRRLLRGPGLPCFVKPANLGSSVGVTKVKTAAELPGALDLAARLDRRVICERAVDAREIECGVLGNDLPEASVPGEILPNAEFYDYQAKYTEGGSRLIIPADLPPDIAAMVRDLARRCFLALDCAGMARVDFFLERGSGRLLVNELNTIPGFTATSMFAKLWEATGVPYGALLARLIDLALERHAERRLAWEAQRRLPADGG